MSPNRSLVFSSLVAVASLGLSGVRSVSSLLVFAVLLFLFGVIGRGSDSEVVEWFDLLVCVCERGSVTVCLFVCVLFGWFVVLFASKLVK